MASLAESGQQTPIVVVAAADHSGRYVVIDGHKRIAALQQLGRDTVEATVWAMSEAEALLLDRSLRFSPHESALEQGWLLSEMERRLGYSLEELARRELDRMAARIGKEQGAQHAEPGTTNGDSGTEREGSGQTRDGTCVAAIAPDRAQSPAIELHPRAGNPTGGESLTLPARDPRSFDFLQGESRASP